MNKATLAAIIGATGAVIAALVGVFHPPDNHEEASKINLNVESNGTNSAAFGIIYGPVEVKK